MIAARRSPRPSPPPKGGGYVALLLLALVGCRANAPTAGPEARCADVCEARARSVRGRELRARVPVRARPARRARRGDGVIACVAKAKTCDDVTFASCAAVSGPYTNGGAGAAGAEEGSRPRRRLTLDALRAEDRRRPRTRAHLRAGAEARRLARPERHVHRRRARLRGRARRAHRLLRVAGGNRREAAERRRHEEPARRRRVRARARSDAREPGREHEGRPRGARAARLPRVRRVPEARRRRDRAPREARAHLRARGGRAREGAREGGLRALREAEDARARVRRCDVLPDLDGRRS